VIPGLDGIALVVSTEVVQPPAVAERIRAALSLCQCRR
jgi:hypothetical protein